MRIISFIIIAFLISSCNEKKSSSKEELVEGQWKIIEIDGEEVNVLEGIHFAPNRQYFKVDSQGKMVPRLIEKIWSVDGDTLKMVDYNWEPEFIEENGTSIFIIQELTNEVMILEDVKNFKGQVIKYKKRK